MDMNNTRSTKGGCRRVMDNDYSFQLHDHDIKGKEGLVHVSQMDTTRRRILTAKDVVKRDQEVFVKVIYISCKNGTHM